MKKWLIILMLLLAVPCWGAVDFPDDADSDYISIAEVDSCMDIASNELTMAAWVKRETSSESRFSWAISRRTASGNVILNLGVNLWSHVVTTRIRDATLTEITSEQGVTAMTLGQWHHIAYTWDGANVYVYLDGVEDAGPDPHTSTGYAGTDVFWIGDDRIDGNNDLDGAIEDAAMWDKALTGDEIALLAKSRGKRMPLQIQPDNLCFYLPLDDFGDGTALDTSSGGYKDLSGKGHNGTGGDADGDADNVAGQLTYP